MINDKTKQEFLQAISEDPTYIERYKTKKYDEFVFLQKIVLEKLEEAAESGEFSPLAINKDNEVFKDYALFITEMVYDNPEGISEIKSCGDLFDAIRKATEKNLKENSLTTYYLSTCWVLPKVLKEFREHFDKESALSLFKNAETGADVEQLTDIVFYPDCEKDNPDELETDHFDDVYLLYDNEEDNLDNMAKAVAVCAYGLNNAGKNEPAEEIDEEEARGLIEAIGIDTNNLSEHFIEKVADNYNTNFAFIHEYEQAEDEDTDYE